MNEETTVIVIVFMFLVLSISLIYAGLGFFSAKLEISKINIYQIEHCVMLECEISIMGDLKCKQVRIPGINRSDLMPLNFTPEGVNNGP